MEYPKSILNIVKKANQKYPHDVGKAIEWAKKYVRKLKDFGTLETMLVDNAIKDMVYEDRHTVNRRIKKDSGGYYAPTKVSPGGTETSNRIAESIYLYRIAGTTIGRVKGCDLEEIAATEVAIGNGHLFNARLCRRLKKVVPKDKMVDEAVKETQLVRIFAEVGKGR